MQEQSGDHKHGNILAAPARASNVFACLFQMSQLLVSLPIFINLLFFVESQKGPLN